MRSSEQTDKIDEQMALVQRDLAPVRKDKDVEVSGEKAKWSSKYSTLAVLYQACHAILGTYGIAIYQGGVHMVPGGERYVTRLAYKGQWIESDFPIKAQRDGAQAFGGGASFCRRWGLCGMVGLVPVDDLDESAGYQGERTMARTARAKVAPGLAQTLANLRAAGTATAFDALTRGARAEFSRGEEATQVERVINDWFLAACDVIESADQLTEIKDLVRRVQPRGGDVRSALGRAEQKVGVPRG